MDSVTDQGFDIPKHNRKLVLVLTVEDDEDIKNGVARFIQAYVDIMSRDGFVKEFMWV